MVVGDSFAHGNCVPEGKDTAADLRSLGFTGVTVGYEGSGPLSQLGTIVEYAPITRPKHIVWLFFEGNDVSDYGLELKRQPLPEYLRTDGFTQHLAERQNEIDGIWKPWVEHELASGKSPAPPVPKPGVLDNLFHFDRLSIENVLKLRSFRGLIGTRFRWPVPCPFVPDHAAVLRRAQQVIDAWGGDILFVYLAADLGADSEDYVCKDAILKNVQRMGIKVVDFEAVLRAHQDGAPFQNVRGMHYNAKGYRLLAEKIAPLLK